MVVFECSFHLSVFDNFFFALMLSSTFWFKHQDVRGVCEGGPSRSTKNVSVEFWTPHFEFGNTSTWRLAAFCREHLVTFKAQSLILYGAAHYKGSIGIKWREKSQNTSKGLTLIPQKTFKIQHHWSLMDPG